MKIPHRSVRPPCVDSLPEAAEKLELGLVAVVHAIGATGRVALTFVNNKGVEAPTDVAKRFAAAVLEERNNKDLIFYGQEAKAYSPGATTQTSLSTQVPLDIVLHCPSCHLQHIDGVRPATAQAPAWDNPPHRSHLCLAQDGGCGHVWRPADIATNGVFSAKSAGAHDSTCPVGGVPVEADEALNIVTVSPSALQPSPEDREYALREAANLKHTLLPERVEAPDVGG